MVQLGANLLPEEEKERTFERRGSSRSDDYEDWDSRYMLRTDQDDFGGRYNEMWGQKGWFKPSCVPITIILVLIVLVVLLPLLDAAEKRSQHGSLRHSYCRHNCSFVLVETIPEGLEYNDSSIGLQSTYNVWMNMISQAKHTIEIASFYWTLQAADTANKDYPGTQQGADVFEALLSAGKKRGLKLKIVQSQPSKSFMNTETETLSKKAHAEVRSVNMPKLVGAGVLHTKLWLVDRESLYVGSANTDWRALSQVKEMGLYVTNCSCILQDMSKIFDVYWAMGVPNAVIPEKWPESLSTDYNNKTPLNTYINNSLAAVYIASSPKEFCPKGRTVDLDGILDVVEEADEFVYVAVMDYFPLMIYTHRPQFWPDIDNALRKAAIDNRIEVRLLISLWPQTRPSEFNFLRSLTALNNATKGIKVSVKMFAIPADHEQAKIPYARVNHNKYMVTDNVAYIGTSNWSGDYFTSTAGIGFIIQGNTTLRDQLESVFLRDWNSQYAHPLSDYDNIQIT